jgi:predicted TPR repeat methyltransferase
MSRRDRRAEASGKTGGGSAEAETLFRTALEHHRRRDFAATEPLYRRILAIAPRHFGTLNGLADICLAQNRLDEAVAVLREAVACDAGYAPARNNLGLALQRLGRAEEAIGHYRQAMASRPGFFDAEYNLGNALLELQRWEEAVDAYRRALALQPDAAGAHNNLGNALRKLGRHGEAAAAYREALRCAPSLSPVYFSLATALARAGEREAAIRAYEDYLRRDPADLYGARFGLAYLGAAAVPERTSAEHLDHIYAARAGGWKQGEGDESGYQGAKLVAAAATAAVGDARGLAVCDAGCGTGLVGQLVKPLAGRLDGVDLAAAMLARAAATGVYDRLEQAELAACLAARPGTYDLVVSAATLIHFGDLGPVFNAVAAALRAGGVFVFTVFPLDRPDAGGPEFGATPFQCFAHSPAHIAAAAAAAGFTVAAQDRAVHEYHHGTPVIALVVTLRRPG